MAKQMVRISGGAVAARVRKMQMASGDTAALARNCRTHHHPQLGHVERGDEQAAVGRDADAGDDQRALRGPAEVAVADHVGHGQPEEGGQPDDGVDLAALGRARGGTCRMKKRLPNSGRAGAGEAEDGHGHQLVVERADAQQPGHGRAQQDPGRLLLLGLQVHARGLEDVAALVGPLVRLAQREEGEADGDAGQGDEQAVAPVVGHGDDVAEDQDADRLRERVGQVVPAEDPAPALGRVGVGQVRVVHGVVDAEPDRGGQVEEGERPHVGRERHERCRRRQKISRATPATTLRLPRSAHRASGTAHSSCATWATKATAPERRRWTCGTSSAGCARSG